MRAYRVGEGVLKGWRSIVRDACAILSDWKISLANERSFHPAFQFCSESGVFCNRFTVVRTNSGPNVT